MTSKYICFLGASGVGKSTLINALVSNDGISVVPAGGIGPYTAQAIIVRYGDRASFKAEYHPKEQVLGLLAGLAKIYEPKVETRNKARLKDIYKLISKDLLCRIEEGTQGNKKEQQTTRHEHIKQASLLITGQQDIQKDISYLIDGLYAIIYGKVLFSNLIESADVGRIGKTRALIEKGKFECNSGQNNKFRDYLNDHATGHLAPIVKSFEVRVKSDLLKNGLVLVDLPGIGIEGDIHQNVTKEKLAHSDAVVLVVSTRGISDAEHRRMKSARIYDRLFATDGVGRDRPVNLAIAVTRVDDIAHSRYKHDKSKKKLQHLVRVCSETEIDIRKQLKLLLRDEWIALGNKKEETVTVDRISREITIVPVAAVEFRRLCVQDPDDRPFITNASQSNIPRLRQTLSLLCRHTY